MAALCGWTSGFKLGVALNEQSRKSPVCGQSKFDIIINIATLLGIYCFTLNVNNLNVKDLGTGWIQGQFVHYSADNKLLTLSNVNVWPWSPLGLKDVGKNWHCDFFLTMQYILQYEKIQEFSSDDLNSTLCYAAFQNDKHLYFIWAHSCMLAPSQNFHSPCWLTFIYKNYIRLIFLRVRVGRR